MSLAVIEAKGIPSSWQTFSLARRSDFAERHVSTKLNSNIRQRDIFIFKYPNRVSLLFYAAQPLNAVFCVYFLLNILPLFFFPDSTNWLGQGRNAHTLLLDLPVWQAQFLHAMYVRRHAQNRREASPAASHFRPGCIWHWIFYSFIWSLCLICHVVRQRLQRSVSPPVWSVCDGRATVTTL